MSISIEAARQRLITNYGIDVDKYTNDEIVDELSEKLEGMLSFGLTAILPVIVTGIISLIATIALWFNYNSVIFSILFFVFSIPVFLLGAGMLGLSNAVNNIYTGITFILGFSNNITNDIRKGRSTAGNTNYKDLPLLVSYGIVFPIVKKIIRKSFLGGILYFIIEKAVNKGSQSISSDNTSEINDANIPNSNNTNNNINNESNTNSLFIVTDKIKNASKVGIKSTIGFLKVLGIVFIVIGLILIGLLFLVYFVIK
ncbi:MAG TPA: hypothetical protein PK566_05915 [Pseudobacteroides sp.]|nr:hypothetical protein [Pseudobacteroides sp.]